MTELTTHINWSFPTQEQVVQIASGVEAEMHGQPVNAETKSKYVAEIRRRMTDLVIVEICEHTNL